MVRRRRFGRAWAWLFGLCALASFALSVDGTAYARGPGAAQAPLRVLLIGNSYTKFNVMPRLLQKLSAAVPGVRALHVDAETHGGFSLRAHWNAGLAQARIRTGRYDAVVLQSHSLSAVDHPGELDEYAQRFKEVIDRAGARAVLYETWARKDGAKLYRTHERVRSFSEMSAIVGGAYSSLALRLGAGLAPVGRAFERELGAGAIELYRSDSSHPTPAGSFLAACVIYGAVTGEDPRSSSYVPFGLAESAALELKTVAAQAVASVGRDREPRALPAETAPLVQVKEAVAVVRGSVVPAVSASASETESATESESVTESESMTESATESESEPESVTASDAESVPFTPPPPDPPAIVAPPVEPVAAAPGPPAP
jgi:hypothetical protein